MSDQDYYQNQENEEELLSEVKQLTLTRNELIYLSDEVTLIMEHVTDQGRISLPARSLKPSASVPVPIELINTIGMGLLIASDKANTSNEATLLFNTADLYVLRECCSSWAKINEERVGYNLLQKIYKLLLEDSFEEKQFIDKLTSGIDFSLQNVNSIQNSTDLEKSKEKTDDTKTN
tara:strand:+ start:459 stop:989 length:531 start_codon:yes stop_codon:yes gene_type:complete